MARKNECESKKRDRRAVAKRAAELATVFHQEEFNEEYRWYHDVVMAEEYDIKVVWRCIIHVILFICQDEDNNNSKHVDVVSQKEREGDTRTTSVVETTQSQLYSPSSSQLIFVIRNKNNPCILWNRLRFTFSPSLFCSAWAPPHHQTHPTPTHTNVVGVSLLVIGHIIFSCGQ